MRLGEQTWPRIEGPGDGQLLLVPLGSTEQHGPHLPLDTDTRIAAALAEGIADRLAGAVVAPALPYGSSGEHQSFGGTLSIGRAALEHLLVELIRSAGNTFSAVVLLNGHGGNTPTVDAVVDAMQTEGHQVHAIGPGWDGGRLGIPVDAHAGRIETSLLLHLAPDLVDLDRAEPGATADLATLWPDLVSEGVRAVSANGVLGDPAGASAAEGQALLVDLVERASEDLVQRGLGRPAADC